MEWLTSIRTAIDYIEEHLTDNISAQDVADRVYLSPFFLQKGFSLMTGYGAEDRSLRNPHRGAFPARHRRDGVARHLHFHSSRESRTLTRPFAKCSTIKALLSCEENQL